MVLVHPDSMIWNLQSLALTLINYPRLVRIPIPDGLLGSLTLVVETGTVAAVDTGMLRHTRRFRTYDILSYDL